MANYELLGLNEVTPQLQAPAAADVGTCAGKIYPALGINLGGSTSANLLNDYEEGTWTPSDGSGAALSLTVSGAIYTKIGRAVHIQASITYPSTASGLNAIIAGLPFSANASGARLVLGYSSTTAVTYASGGAGTTVNLFTAGANTTNSSMSAQNIIINGYYTV